MGISAKKKMAVAFANARPFGSKAGGDIMPNASKTTDSQYDFRVLSQGTEIGAFWT